MDLHEQAELYRRGLTAGYITPAEAVEWADRVIATHPNPPIELIEFSLAATGGSQHAELELRPLTAGIPPGSLLAETVAGMRSSLAHDETRAEAIAWELHGMALQHVFPPQADMAEVHAAVHAFETEAVARGTTRAQAVEYLRATLEHLAAALTPAD